MQIPDLISARCLYLRACGTLLTKDPKVIERLVPFRTRKVAHSDAPEAFVVAWGGEEGGCETHFHVDVVSKDAWPKTKGLKINSTVKEIDALFEHVVGQSISVDLEVRFSLPLAEMPEKGLVRGSMAETETAGMLLKQSGAEFTISRGPVERVEWGLSKSKPGMVDLELTVEKTLVIEDAYLKQLLDFTVLACDFLILGKKRDVVRTD